MKKLNRDDHYGGVISRDEPHVKWVQHGNYYDYEGNFLYSNNEKVVESKPEIAHTEENEPVAIPEVIEEEKTPETLSMDSLKPGKKEFIIPKSGKPYKTEDVAWTNMKRKKLAITKHTVVPYKEGWAIVKKS